MAMQTTNTSQQKSTQNASPAHTLQLERGKSMSMTGVCAVPTFTSKNISVNLANEQVQIVGEGLSVKSLNLQSGTLTINGRVDSIKYITHQSPSSFLKKVFR